MSLHNWRDSWSAWLLDANMSPLCRLDDLIAPSVTWRLRDEFSYTASLPVDSPNYASLDPDTDQFIVFWRTAQAGQSPHGQVAAVQLLDSKWKIVNGEKRKLVDLAGEGGNFFFLGSRVLQADTAGSDRSVTVSSRSVDDAIKQFVRLATVAGTAYADPNAAARHIPGFTVAADKGEHPTSQAWTRTGNLWDVVELLCLEYDIDVSLIPTWNGPDAAVTLEFDTHYQGRGANNSVFLNDLLKVYSDSAWHTNRAPMKTHGYSVDTATVFPASDYSGRFRREVVIDAQGTADIAVAMRDMREEKGHTFQFVETQACQVGVDIWLGDTIQHHDTELGTTVRAELLSGIIFSIQKNALGTEKLQLIFGDKKPTSTNSGGGGGRSGGRRSRIRQADGPESIHAPSDVSYVTMALDSTLTAERQLAVGASLSLTDGGANSTATIDLVNTAVTPSTYGDATHVGQFTVDQKGRLTGASAVEITGVPPAAHTLLNATRHGDTATGTVQRGDIIKGNATPVWQRLVIGAANSLLSCDGADPSWSATPTVTTLTTTSTLTVQGAYCYLTNTGTYVWGSGTNAAINAATGGNIRLQFNGVNVYLATEAAFYPATTGVTALGLTTRRWSDIQTELVTVYTRVVPDANNGADLGTNAVRFAHGYINGLTIDGHITITGNVDGVDVSAFKTAYDAHVTAYNAHVHAVSGNTASGQPAGAINLRNSNNTADLFVMGLLADPSKPYIWASAIGGADPGAWLQISWQSAEIDPAEIAHNHTLLIDSGTPS